ncbi:hypothetical protein Aut01nite_72130 [Actinoplanes utahensis]|nr:hypothetical protein Aut01nite_72130 [Actinoplanes utahensis]
MLTGRALRPGWLGCGLLSCRLLRRRRLTSRLLTGRALRPRLLGCGRLGGRARAGLGGRARAGLDDRTARRLRDHLLEDPVDDPVDRLGDGTLAGLAVGALGRPFDVLEGPLYGVVHGPFDDPLDGPVAGHRADVLADGSGRFPDRLPDRPVDDARRRLVAGLPEHLVDGLPDGHLHALFDRLRSRRRHPMRVGALGGRTHLLDHGRGRGGSHADRRAGDQSDPQHQHSRQPVHIAPSERWLDKR